MSDLISRQALLEDARKTITERSDTMDWLNIITRQPIAYDIDKVVEQLRENDNICAQCLNNKNSISVCEEFCDIGKRLKIVKVGGVNE